MWPGSGEVLHFSEDPGIARFVPHVAVTARQPEEAYVWAVDAARAPDYWFPRQCPRILAWAGPDTTAADRDRLLGGDRVHVIERAWADAMRTTALYAYRLPAAAFRPFSDTADAHAHVAEVPVVPLGPPEPVGDLIACHAAAGIPLRLVDELWPFWDEVTAGTVAFSGIRLRNAAQKPSGSAGS